MKAKVRCIETYNDTELNTKITNNPEDKNYERVVSIERAIVLDKARVCEILEAFNEEEIENTKLDENEEEIENTKLDDNEEEIENAKINKSKKGEKEKKKTK